MLDTAGAGGFAFAFQDKIVDLYTSDDYAFNIQSLLNKIAPQQISFLESIFSYEDQTQGCNLRLQDAYSTIMNAYGKLQRFFMDQYIGNVNVLRDGFYQACSNLVC